VAGVVAPAEQPDLDQSLLPVDTIFGAFGRGLEASAGAARCGGQLKIKPGNQKIDKNPQLGRLHMSARKDRVELRAATEPSR
jgi:hypothetical protein